MREAIGVIGGLLAMGVIQIIANYPPGSSQDWAAWIQAFGSIGAIAGAVWVTDRQNRQARERDTALRAERLAEVRRTISIVLQEAWGLIKGVPGSKGTWDAMNDYVHVVAIRHFDTVEKMLESAPIYEAESERIVRAAISMLEALRCCRKIIEECAKMPTIQLRVGWVVIQASIDDQHRQADWIMERIRDAGFID